MSTVYADHVAWQLVGPEAVIVDLRSGCGIGLNPTAAFVWSRLPTDSLPAIANELATRFDVNRASALEDLEGFVESLRSRGLVVER